MQVDNSYQRYYVNKQTNTYIGGVAMPIYANQRVMGCSATCRSGATVVVPCTWC